MAESDQITAQASARLFGATVVRKYYHHDEPMVEVTVEVPLQVVVNIIRELHTRSIQSDDIRPADIRNVTESIKTKTFQATGIGVPSEKFLTAFNASIKHPEDRIPAWAARPIHITGNGTAPENKAGTPQGKLLAARTAEVDAKRKLSEHVLGLKIAADRRMKDLAAEHDEIHAHIDGILVGAIVEETTFQGDTAAVIVSVPGMALWQVIHERLRADRLRANGPAGS